MGAGERFQFALRKGIGFGIYFDNFPYKVGIDIHFLCFSMYLGFGKAYTDA